jgi:hypothetical protein
LKKLFPILAVLILLDYGCQNGRAPDKPPAIPPDRQAADPHVKQVFPAFARLEPDVATAFTNVAARYFELKDALADGSETQAKSKGRELLDALDAAGKTHLTAAQRTAFLDGFTDARENAEHIGKSQLDHQRSHFAALSELMYNIFAAFGAGQTIYLIRCGKAENGDGALWLTNAIDHKNPYLGKAGIDCFEISEKIVAP